MKLEDIGKLINDSYQLRIGIAVLVLLILLLPYFEISIYGVLFGAMIAGLIGLPILVIYGKRNEQVDALTCDGVSSYGRQEATNSTSKR